MIKKQKVIRSRKYLDSHEGCECFACGSYYGVVGAHIRPGSRAGMSRKPSDDLTISLCFYCHQEEGSNPRKFWKKLGYTIKQIKEIARARYRSWKDGKAGNNR